MTRSLTWWLPERSRIVAISGGLMNKTLRPARAEAAVRGAFEAGNLEAAATAGLQHFGPELRHYLRRHLGRTALAEDAFSDFSERIWSSLPSFRWRCSFRTWAFALARRAAADARRADVRERRRRLWVSDSRVNAIVEPPRSDRQPWQQTEVAASVAQMREALRPEDNALLVLRGERGLEWKQIARLLHESDPPQGAALTREAARLRKRFQLLKRRLRDRARESAGVLVRAPAHAPRAHDVRHTPERV